jgi:hypothetical protein
MKRTPSENASERSIERGGKQRPIGKPEAPKGCDTEGFNMKWLIGWIILAAALYCSVNWFLLPNFQFIARIMPHLSFFGAVGASAILVIAGILFGRDK